MQFTAYIDEAGDDGFGKLRPPIQGSGQSRWLILGALIVGPHNDRQLPAWRNSIRAKFPSKKNPDLHFKELSHEQKIVVAHELAKLPIGLSLTLSHKVTIPGSRFEETFKQKGYLYNFLLRWLLERLIDAAKLAGKGSEVSLKVVFSRRKGTDYDSVKDYLRKLADGAELFPSPRTTDWSVLDIENIEVENHTKRAGLQLADCVASAFFNAVNPDIYGNYEPRYALALREKLLRRAGLCNQVGLTVVPNIGAAKCDEAQRRFFRECEQCGQAPGS